MSIDKLPDEGTMAWVGSVLGEFEIVSSFAHGHGYSELWRVSSATGFAWIKLPRYRGKWAGEVYALENWALSNVPSPVLLARCDEPLSLLLSEVPGQMATEVELTVGAEARLWREAGAYISALHQRKNDWFGAVWPDGTSQGAPHLDAATFVRDSLEARIRQGIEKNLWEPGDLEFIQAATAEWTPALEGELPVSVHRDFGPRNWLTNEQGELTAVIDWEHARWDVRAADLNRPWDDLFVSKPHLAAPFEEGYGGFNDRLRAQIQAMRLLGAVGGIVWATSVGDWPYVELNRAAIRRLRR